MGRKLKNEAVALPEPSPRQRREYDGFGPWALKVSQAEDMPPRFDPWYEELAESALMLKLPRSMERRDLRPGDECYEAVLAIDDRGVHYLERKGRGEIQRTDVGFGEISAVRMEKDLLNGHLGFDLRDGSTVAVAFNTVSAPLLGNFLDRSLLGLSSRGGMDPFEPSTARSEPGEGDSLFRFLLRELRESTPELELLAWQAPCRLKAGRGGRRGILGLIARLLPWKLDACLIAQASWGLVGIRETDRPRARATKGYHYETIHIPAGCFLGAEALSRILPNGAAFASLKLSVEGHSYEFPFLESPRLERRPAPGREEALP